ncbi:MAG: SIS domain-containing protein [Lachnospiraceae bacterium]
MNKSDFLLPKNETGTKASINKIKLILVLFFYQNETGTKMVERDYMSFQERYISYCKTILEEHASVFEKQDMLELYRFLQIIVDADRVFIVGAGREGIAARSFAMRLMHLGKEVHWVWNDTTPGMQQGDLLIAVNGSGKIGHIDYLIEQAMGTGVKVGVITGSPLERVPRIAHEILFVPASVYKGTDLRVVASVQPMGNLFEQHLFLLFDVMVMLLREEMNLTYEQMESRHRNVE